VVIQLTKIIISGGKTINSNSDSVENSIQQVNQLREWLHAQKVDDLLDFFNELGNYWGKEMVNVIGPNARHVSTFLSKSHLGNKLDVALHGNRYSLDKFVDLGDKNLLLHAQPKGLVVHWIAGNVDILGIFSVIQSLITKNVSILKAPSKYDQLVQLLESFKKIKTKSIDGSKLLQCVELLYIEHSDIKNQSILSKSADVRIAWGGWDAVNTIVLLPKSPFCDDIVYGPKYSYAIIDEESILKNKKNIAQKIAVDVSMFDQYACSSPHTILIDTENSSLLEDFARELGNALDDVNRLLLPKPDISPEKSVEIVSIRSEFSITGKVFSSDGVEWTVILSEGTDLASPTFSRVVHVKKLDKNKITNIKNSDKIQTIGLSTNKNFDFIDEITFRGGDRCPQIGTMSMFDSPWDGMFGMDRMVRWISVFK
jgi:hypothetical protein